MSSITAPVSSIFPLPGRAVSRHVRCHVSSNCSKNGLRHLSHQQQGGPNCNSGGSKAASCRRQLRQAWERPLTFQSRQTKCAWSSVVHELCFSASFAWLHEGSVRRTTWNLRLWHFECLQSAHSLVTPPFPESPIHELYPWWSPQSSRYFEACKRWLLRAACMQFTLPASTTHDAAA